MILMIFSLYAKDSFGIGLQFGALGSKPTYPNLSTTSCDVPYSFNPNVHVDLQIPVCDIDAISFFSINVGYDFSWNYYRIEYNKVENKENFHTSHLISLIPTITFTKSNFRFFLGTGLSLKVRPSPYEPSLGIGTTFDSDDIDYLGLAWTINTGLKYKLGKNVFFVADMAFFVNLDEDYESVIKEENMNPGDFEKYSLRGGASMQILPKIGLMISF